jgi:hypothetical protein
MLYLEQALGTYWTGGHVGSRMGTNMMVKIKTPILLEITFLAYLSWLINFKYIIPPIIRNVFILVVIKRDYDNVSILLRLLRIISCLL